MTLLKTLMPVLALTSYVLAGTNGVPTAKIRNGLVKGLHLETFDQDIFLGIPFAEAPRLDNPRPINMTWNETFDATHFGPACYGFGSNIDLNLTQSEDCLNLNIVRPSEYFERALPVLVWVYGGGFTQGSNADPMMNLSYIVQTSVENQQPSIAVSINYRLSFLGFPGGNVSLEAGISNLGLKDQQIALQWIQQNIRAFGGDPKRVTIWGESAGGVSVGLHLISRGGKGSEGLFRGAIMSSGTVVGAGNPKSPYALNGDYDQIVDHAGCANTTNTLQCLRAVPIEAIYPFERIVSYSGPVIDGDFIQREPLLELNDGNVHRVPIVLGANSDEGLFVVNLLGSPNDEAALRKLCQTALPGLSNSTIGALLTAYPSDGPAPPYTLRSDFPWCTAVQAANISDCTPLYRRTAAILGDFFADLGRRMVSQRWPEAVYSYRFVADSTSIPITYWKGLGPGFANHGTDIAYGFRLPGNFTTSIHYYPPVKPTPGHEGLSRVMASRYISFVHGLDPNAVALPSVVSWPRYNDKQVNYVFNVSPEDHIDIHLEPDTYRERGIGIWMTHAFEAFYGDLSEGRVRGMRYKSSTSAVEKNPKYML
ncbi:Hypothetical predicted protein [Lecanosticta acicola]|uniref:Carboxylic ester hydrolase n=1 Tax=Lecanosticta acicola TaxID=111012 RepID=A0AAI9EAJ1_9PEZI|nr:Hypothetical predicted protein [Lecanosticta acicola]